MRSAIISSMVAARTLDITTPPADDLVRGLDFAMLARYAVREDTPQALREFEDELRGNKAG